jgi:hypothetical protein
VGADCGEVSGVEVDCAEANDVASNSKVTICFVMDIDGNYWPSFRMPRQAHSLGETRSR